MQKADYDQPRPRVCHIHVAQPTIRKNLKDQRAGRDGYAPAIVAKRGGENVYGHTVVIYDKQGNVVATVVQPKGKKLSCGARIWISTHAVVEVREEKADHILVTELLR